MNPIPGLLILPGDGIGPEVMAQALRVLERVGSRAGISLEIETGLVDGAAIDAAGTPPPAMSWPG